MTDLETLLRAVSDLRAEIRGDIAAIRGEMSTAAARAVDRGEHAAQLAGLERRVGDLETARRGVLTGLIWPMVVGVLVAAVTYLLTTRGGR